MPLFLRNQLDLLTAVEAHIRDPENYRWQEHEIYNALNDGLRNWHGRVECAGGLCTSTNWPSTVSVIDLPDGIDAESAVIQLRYLPIENATDPDYWYDAGAGVEPSEAFGGQLRVFSAPRPNIGCSTGSSMAPCRPPFRPWTPN